MCDFNRCCPTYPQIRLIAGPQGPIGPQGPAGVIISYIASFLNDTTANPVAVGTTIPLLDQFNYASDYISHTAPSTTINLDAGTYLVTYSANASSDTAGELGITANLNGVAIPNSASTLGGTNENAVLNKQFIIQVPTGTGALTFTNSGTNPTTFENLNIVIQRLSV